MIVDNDAGIREILKTVRTVAVVGCSPNPGPKNYVPAYMQGEGYRIIPVNPRYNEVLGERCYATLQDIPVRVDMVDCFRPSGDILPIAEAAVAIGAKVLWMQAGIINEEAARLASAAGLQVVMDRCPCAEIPRLIIGKKESWRNFKKRYTLPITE
ncbi:MAG: CoA-binding protein [Alistipes senegalensis]|nr:CoA-binding protein [Oxalobacter formigenes]MCM1281122.1 CoA-binding protein [Alistipes senegalensis]